MLILPYHRHDVTHMYNWIKYTRCAIEREQQKKQQNEDVFKWAGVCCYDRRYLHVIAINLLYIYFFFVLHNNFNLYSSLSFSTAVFRQICMKFSISISNDKFNFHFFVRVWFGSRVINIVDSQLERCFGEMRWEASRNAIVNFVCKINAIRAITASRMHWDTLLCKMCFMKPKVNYK